MSSYRYEDYVTTLKQESRDLYDRCVDEAHCEVYVPARAHSLPTDDERLMACTALGGDWQIAADQTGVRPGFVKCFNRALFEKRVAAARSNMWSSSPLLAGLLVVAGVIVVAGIVNARRR
jgi:hypothetical protein